VLPQRSKTGYAPIESRKVMRGIISSMSTSIMAGTKPYVKYLSVAVYICVCTLLKLMWPLTIRVRFSANSRAVSETIRALVQLNEGIGASVSARSRAATSTMFATIPLSKGPSGKRSGYTSRIRPCRTARTSCMRPSRAANCVLILL